MKSNRNPVLEIMELLSAKWAMRAVWELRGEPLTFRALQEACGNPSPTVLNTRLKELTAQGIVEKTGHPGYALTTKGRDLLAMYPPLKTWAEKWQTR